MIIKAKITDQPVYDYQIPEETVKVAKAAFPNGNIYLTLRDKLGPIFEDQIFRDYYSILGKAAESPGRLALITILQYLENLPDRHAVEAVRCRIDWKYLLGLHLNDPGFDFIILNEFRKQLLEGNAESLMFEKLLNKCEESGLLKHKMQQGANSSHIVAAVRTLNLFELIGEKL